MKSRFGKAKAAAVSAAALAMAVFATTSPAQAQHVRTVDGQSYWTGDPGPVAPGSFWADGEYKYDPNHFLAYWAEDPQDYADVVHADHEGAARCVWRKRVVNSDWEYEHPYLRIRRPWRARPI
jgi:hypothetical protein